MKTFFPFTVRFPIGFKDVFMTHKPKDLLWFEFDVVVRSKTSVTFLIYNMKDNYWGGRGDKIKTMPVNNIKAKDIKPLIKSQLEQKSFEIQFERQEQKEEIERIQIVKKLREQFL